MKKEMVCTSCGAVYIGGPSSKFCPACSAERSRMRRRKKKICIVCGKDITGTLAQKYCPACALSKKQEKKKAEYAQMKADLGFSAEKPVQEQKHKMKGSGLSDAVALLESYNRINNTNYSYGQAVRRGII